MATKEELEKKIDKFEVNMTRTDRIVNGTENEDVSVDDGQLVPSIRKWQKEMEGEYGVPAEAVTQAQAASTSAQESATLAGEYVQEASNVVNAVTPRVEALEQFEEDLSDPALGANLVAFPSPDGTPTTLADLANPDKGAAMVARGVVTVDSIAELYALPDSRVRGDSTYMVRGSTFRWVDGAFEPQGHVGVDAWLPDFADTAAALESAIESGFPLDFKNLKISVSRRVLPSPLIHAVDWISSGCTITLTSGMYESVMHLRLPAEDHSIEGKLILDANSNAYVGFQALSTTGYCVFVSTGLEARNVYRSGTVFPRGDGMFFRGGFSRIELNSPVIKNVRMAAGAGVSQTVGVAGITITSDTGTGLYPKYQLLNNPRIEGVYSEDPLYEFDQDGCRLFGRGESATPEEEDSVAVVIGGEFTNCAGRSIKGQVSSLTVDGTTFRRNGAFLREVGNPEVDSQRGPVQVTNIKCFYNGKVPSTIITGSSLLNSDTCSHFVESVTAHVVGTTLPFVVGVSSSLPWRGHLGARGIYVNGKVERFVTIRTNTDGLSFDLRDMVASEVTSEGVLLSTSTGGSSPYAAQGSVQGLRNLGPVQVPLARHRVPGTAATLTLTAYDVHGFHDSRLGTFTAGEVNPILRVTGITTLEDGGSSLRPYTATIPAGETVVFPVQGYGETSNTTSIVLVQVNSPSNDYTAVLALNRGGATALAAGARITPGGLTDPGGEGFGVWANADGSFNVKNNTGTARQVSILRFG